MIFKGQEERNKFFWRNLENLQQITVLEINHSFVKLYFLALFALRICTYPTRKSNTQYVCSPDLLLQTAALRTTL